MSKEEPVETRIEKACIQAADRARVDAVMWMIFLFVYGWLFFKGGLSEFIDEGMALIFSRLPYPFASWNGLALAWGIAYLIGYRALVGSSWFVEFDDSPIKQKLFPDAPSKRALLYGIISYFGVVNGTILLFWLVLK